MGAMSRGMGCQIQEFSMSDKQGLTPKPMYDMHIPDTIDAILFVLAILGGILACVTMVTLVVLICDPLLSLVLGAAVILSGLAFLTLVR